MTTKTSLMKFENDSALIEHCKHMIEFSELSVTLSMRYIGKLGYIIESVAKWSYKIDISDDETAFTITAIK